MRYVRLLFNVSASSEALTPWRHLVERAEVMGAKGPQNLSFLMGKNMEKHGKTCINTGVVVSGISRQTQRTVFSSPESEGLDIHKDQPNHCWENQDFDPDPLRDDQRRGGTPPLWYAGFFPFWLEYPLAIKHDFLDSAPFMFFPLKRRSTDRKILGQSLANL